MKIENSDIIKDMRAGCSISGETYSALEKQIDIMKNIFPEFCYGKKCVMQREKYEEFYQRVFTEIIMHKGDKFSQKSACE